MPRPALAAAIAAALSCLLPGQTLVANLVTNTGGNPGSGIDRFHLIGARAVFAAQCPWGVEPWVTDGTTLGTTMLADLMPQGSSSPLQLLVHGANVFFTANVPGIGRELWKTDGTNAGTVLVKDIYPGAVSGNPLWLVEFNGFVYFAATDPTFGQELWRSDGTEAGTTLVADIRVGGGSSGPNQITVVGNRLFFAATDLGTGTELWVSDGTAAGTTLVADLNPGGFGAALNELAPFGNRLLFGADVGNGNGSEPWVSDGTAAGTFALGDLQPGVTDSLPRDFTAAGGLAVFSALGPGVGRELYVTDGTLAGTSLLLDIRAGVADGNPDLLTPYNGIVVFAANGADGVEPWRTDGTLAGTYQLADLATGTASSSPFEYAPVNGELWFGANGTGLGSELFHTDGTVAGTGLVADLVPGPIGAGVQTLVQLGSEVLFVGTIGNAGYEPCLTDGTVAGTSLVDDLARPASNSSPRDFADLGSRVFFIASTNSSGTEPHVTDGTPTGTTMLADVQPGSFGSNCTTRVARGADVFFDGNLFLHGAELFLADGVTRAVTQLTNAAPAVAPRGLAALGGLVVFSGVSANGREPWVSDGTPAGTFELLDVNPGAADGFTLFSEKFTTVAGQTFFAANDGSHGVELWVTDGTSAGTHLVADLLPGASSSNPNHLIAFGGLCYFTAVTPGIGTELWRSDGTLAGTVLVKDVFAGPAGSNPADTTVAGGDLYFTASTPTGRQIFVSDGTAGGTVPVTSTASTAGTPYSDLTATQIGLFFLHDDLTGAGVELWHTTGTLASTHRVLDIGPGQISGPVPGTLASAFGGTQLIFGATDLANGLQLWRTDGTTASTVPVTSFGEPGRGAVSFAEFFATGPVTYFACDDGINGVEPWLFDPVNGGVAFVLPYGNACTGSTGLPAIGANGLPTLGNPAFAITLANALPLSLAVQASSSGSTGINLGGCYLWVDIPFTLWWTTLVDAAGTAAAPLPIPTTPSLVGSNLFFQWGVLDPAGPFSGLALTGGLQIQVGN